MSSRPNFWCLHYSLVAMYLQLPSPLPGHPWVYSQQLFCWYKYVSTEGTRAQDRVSGSCINQWHQDLLVASPWLNPFLDPPISPTINLPVPMVNLWLLPQMQSLLSASTSTAGCRLLEQLPQCCFIQYNVDYWDPQVYSMDMIGLSACQLLKNFGFALTTTLPLTSGFLMYFSRTWPC